MYCVCGEISESILKPFDVQSAYDFTKRVIECGRCSLWYRRHNELAVLAKPKTELPAGKVVQITDSLRLSLRLKVQRLDSMKHCSQ